MQDTKDSRETKASPNIVAILKVCTKKKDLEEGSKIHAYVREHKLLEKNCYVACSLVSMYARCGALATAWQVLDELPVRDAVMWNALVAGYAQHRQGKEALECFDIMQVEGHSPDDVTFVCALKACGSIAAAARGKKIHETVENTGLLEKNIVVGSSLVDMYVKFGALAKAQEVLDELPIRNAIMWTSLIVGYTEQGNGQEALNCFDHMQCEGFSPSEVTIACALKACGSIRAVAKGEKIHDKIASLGLLESNSELGTAVVDMYAKCGALAKAQQALNELPTRNRVTWTMLIAGYTHHGHPKEALHCFNSMQHEGHFPDAVTFICALQACGSIGAAAIGEQIHGKIVSLGLLEKNVVLAGTLVDMYARCGALAKAQEVFNKLHFRNSIMWTALLAGYGQQENAEAALKCFESMQHEGHFPDAVALICALKACGKIGALTKGEQIHDKIHSLSLLEKDTVLGSTLVDMYVKCGAVAKAQEVLDELPFRNMMMWTAVISGYAQQGQGKKALQCFDSMQYEGHSPNAVTFVSALKACGIIRAGCKGEKIHEKIISLGLLEKDIMLGNALVDMYARCGALAKAYKVLEGLSGRNVITWNALIGGYILQGQGKEALKYFNCMQHEGHSPDTVTFICALRACGSIGAVVEGEQIHNQIVSLELLENNVALGTTLVDMYARCGALTKAQEVLENLSVRNDVSWNALILGYAQQGQSEEALKCLDSMQHEGYSPGSVTYIGALKACGSIGAIAKGKKVHEEIVSSVMLEKDIELGNALVDMYVKCATLEEAVAVLEKLPAWDVVTWNTLIGGYAQQGQSGEALDCFERMQCKGVLPDSATFASVLNACSHSGLLDEARMEFLRMITEYGITPNVDHYCCMVDLFGRAGVFKNAITVIQKMPSTDHLPVWFALLGASVYWGNVRIGSFAFAHALQLDVTDAATCICMTNICMAAGIQEDADGMF